MANVTLHEGDVLDVLPGLEAESFDACLCDPPYGLEFMGKEWDAPHKGTTLGDPSEVGGFQDGRGGNPYSRSRVRMGIGAGLQAWHEQWARAVYRTLKPGAHLMAFGGTRTHHRLMCALEDAGFEIRDCLMWLYGSGFPKSLDISKAIDKAAGAEREVVGRRVRRGDKTDYPTRGGSIFAGEETGTTTAPATPEAVRWSGYGTALKPAWEPVILAMKPLAGTFAQNAERHGVAGLNVDGGRVGAPPPSVPQPAFNSPTGKIYGMKAGEGRSGEMSQDGLGRWPANLLFDSESAAMMDRTAGEKRSAGDYPSESQDTGSGTTYLSVKPQGPLYEDSGGPSRFFYTAKASSAERNAGLEDENHHPTLKPLSLTAYLAKLLLPPERDGEPRRLLNPFAGSGSEAIGALRAGWEEVTSIEREPEYAEIARERIRGDAPLFNSVDTAP